MQPMIDWNLFSNPAPLINMASRSFARLGERRVKPFGFSIGQLPVVYLLRHGGAMSQKDLARQAKTEQPSMAQMLSRMERDGLVRRAPDPDDGRAQLISLTEAALEKLPATRAALDEGNQHALAGFSEDEVQMLVGLLRRLNENLDGMVAREE